MRTTIYIQSCEVRTGKNGAPYLAMMVRWLPLVGEQVQRIQGKAWRGNFSESNPPQAGYRYVVDCEQQAFNGTPQLIVSDFLDVVGDGPGDLVESPAVDQEATYRRLFCGAWKDAQLSILFSKIHDALGSTRRAGRRFP